MRALATPGAADADVREAMESLVRTYRTRQSGVVYESRPANRWRRPYSTRAQAAVPAFLRAEQQEFGMSRTRDADVLGILVFLERMGLANDNGRRLGRTFLGLLWEFTGVARRPLVRYLL